MRPCSSGKKRMQVTRKRVRPVVKVMPKRKPKAPAVTATWNRYSPPPNDKFILVYAGEYTAFSVKEFNSMESLARFLAPSQLRKEEYAIIVGNVKRCDPRYKPDVAYRLPWDDGEDSAYNGEEMCTTSQPLTLEDTRQLLGGL